MTFGLISSYGSAALAIPLTTSAVGPGTDDYAILIYLLTIPIGFVVGLVVSILVARGVERQSPSADGLFSRTELTLAGILMPIGTVMLAMAVASTLT